MEKRTQRLIKRFWKFTKKTDGCWLWLGYKNPKGYGRMNEKNKTNYVHRFSYEIHKGKIPKGLCIDHLCRNTSCVNPDHLEAVTQRENILRGESIFAKEARQIECLNGHKYTIKNLRIYDGHRRCRICDLNRYYQKVGRPLLTIYENVCIK